MVAPTLTSDLPGLEVLAEVAKLLAAGGPVEDALAGVVGVLRRRLALRRCRLWLRSGDKVRRYTKFQFQKQKAFDAWLGQAQPAD